MLTARRKNLLVWVTIYYGVSITVLYVLSRYFPAMLPYLPFGGLDTLEQIQRGEFVADVIGEVVVTTPDPIDFFDDAIKLFATMIGAILIMLPLRWVYIGVGLTMTYNHAVAASLVILPLIVTGIVLIVQYSLALAFSLAGIVAGVRYRTTLKNTSDALFVFAAIGVGLAAGTDALDVALVMSIFFSYAVLLLPPITPRADDSPNSPWRIAKARKTKESEEGLGDTEGERP